MCLRQLPDTRVSSWLEEWDLGFQTAACFAVALHRQPAVLVPPFREPVPAAGLAGECLCMLCTSQGGCAACSLQQWRLMAKASSTHITSSCWTEDGLIGVRAALTLRLL